MSRYAIRTESLTRTFGSIHAVNNLSIEVPAGIVFGFLGPNGSGKTTTIRLLLGLLDPTAGRAEALGYDTRTQAGEIRLRAGALLEHPGLYERMSAEDNLEFYGRVWRMSPADRKARGKELLTHLGLWERRKEKVGNWSRGMKQKLAVARTLFHRPKLVFLDEPTAGLDPVASAALREDIADLVTRDGATVFLTTHNLTEAERLCKRIAVIRQGTLLAIGHPDELRTRAGGPQVEITGRGLNDKALAAVKAQPMVEDAVLDDGRLVIRLNADIETSSLVTLLIGEGVAVEEVRKGKASLEDAFLALVEEK